MLIPIPILVDLCPHLVASMTAVRENLSGGLQTLSTVFMFILTIDQSMTHPCYLYGNMQRSVKFHYAFHVE